MGTDTYIVRGKGNPASYNSSSHGAGRRLSRGQAKRKLDPEGLRSAMKGKTWNAWAALVLVDEDPRAYKDIRKVMADQSDLTEVVHVLHQVLNYKGHQRLTRWQRCRDPGRPPDSTEGTGIHRRPGMFRLDGGARFRSGMTEFVRSRGLLTHIRPLLTVFVRP